MTSYHLLLDADSNVRGWWADGDIALVGDPAWTSATIEAASSPIVGQVFNATTETLASPPLGAPKPPPVISDRQFFQQLAIQSVITQDEALAAVSTGAVPAEMQPLIAALPPAAQFAAHMKIAGATEFTRTDPITLAIGEAYGWSSAQLDTLWLSASLL